MGNVRRIKKMKVNRRKKYRLKPLSVALIFVILVSVFILAAIGISNLLKGEDTVLAGGEPNASTTQKPPSNKPESELPPSEPEPPKNSQVRLMGVGDNLIHKGVYLQAQTRAGGTGYDFEYAYKEVKDILAKADIASINQESVMSSLHEPSSYPLFNSPTELGDYMVDGLGFDVVNLANNHVLDRGEKAIFSTLEFWKTKPNVLLTGVYENKETASKIQTMEKNDITFSFLGMTDMLNGLSLPQGSEVVIHMTGEDERIKAQIEEAKKISDVVVVNAHWGSEYTHKPGARQKELAQKMVEWGADIIFGHHPHTIQPVEYIDRPDGTRGIVVYSLGNFISGQDSGIAMIGGLLDVTVEKEFENNTVKITNAEFIPLVTHYDWGVKDIRTYPLSAYTKELADINGVKKFTPDFSLDYLKNTVNTVIDKQFLKGE